MTGEEIRMVGGSGHWDMVAAGHYVDETRITAVRETEIPRHRRRQDGYGTLVPGAHMVQLDGKRWYRVRTTCWSNSGTDFVRIGGRDRILASGWLLRWGNHERAQAYMAHLDARIAGDRILTIASEMARNGSSHGDIADAIAARTGLLRSFVVDLLRRKQSLWMAP